MHRAQNLVTSQRGFDGDLSRFRIANFTDHHNVRVLTEDRPESACESKSDFLLHRHLVDAGNLEFDGILDGNDVELRIIELIERRVECCCLSRTGRASNQKQAMRSIHGGTEAAIGVCIETKLLHAGGKVALVENSEHHLLTMHRGEKRNT